MNRSISKALYTATMTLTAISLAAAPASAASPAAGTSLGSFNDFEAQNVSPFDPLPQCAVNTKDAILTLDNTAIAGALAGGGPTTTAIITIPLETLYFNPAGTFQDAGCTVPAYGPTGLSASIVVKEGSSTGTTLCSGTAQYGRAGEVGLVTASCGPYMLVFDGAQQPCFPETPFDPCAAPLKEWVGTYGQV